MFLYIWNWKREWFAQAHSYNIGFHRKRFGWFASIQSWAQNWRVSTECSTGRQRSGSSGVSPPPPSQPHTHTVRPPDSTRNFPRPVRRPHRVWGGGGLYIICHNDENGSSADGAEDDLITAETEPLLSTMNTDTTITVCIAVYERKNLARVKLRSCHYFKCWKGPPSYSILQDER